MRRILPLLVLALAACNTGFEPQYRVKDLRILDLQSLALGSASTADVAPGDKLQLSALVANPLNRPGLTVDWIACLPQPNQAIPPCLDDAYLQDPARLAAAAGKVPGVVSLDPGLVVTSGPTWAVLETTYPVPSTPDVLAALDFVIGLAQQNSTYECRLYAQLVVVAVASAGGHQSLAYKQIPLLPPTGWRSGASTVCTPGGAPMCVDDRYVLNLNPSVGAIQLNPTDQDACTGGTPVTAPPFAFPSGEVVLCGAAGNGSLQAYNFCEPDGSTTQAFETIDWQWYATDGNFPDSGSGVGDARGTHVKFQRPASGFTLWVIARDGRGGTDWAIYTYPPAGP
jgi:hypothetical protein